MFTLKKIVTTIILATIALVVLNSQQERGRTHITNDRSVVTDTVNNATTPNLPTQTKLDVSYGQNKNQTLDAYIPANTDNAPVIIMVHGGAWIIGDKASGSVITNKKSHYIEQGYIFVSINYPLLPEATPDAQAESVAEAISYVQKNASDWGGDANNVIVMGHSAGAHLIALLSNKQDQYPELAPWSGTVILDSAGLDIVSIMEAGHYNLYDRAFGSDPVYWRDNSPLEQINSQTEPIFIACSTQRDGVCDEANAFALKAKSYDTAVTTYPVNLQHEEINNLLGLPSAYTSAVDDFIESVI